MQRCAHGTSLPLALSGLEIPRGYGPSGRYHSNVSLEHILLGLAGVAVSSPVAPPDYLSLLPEINDDKRVRRYQLDR